MGSTCTRIQKKKTTPEMQSHSLLQVLQTNKIADKYTFQSLLGTGTYGKVILSQSRFDPTFKVAIKILPKSSIENNLEELTMLRELDHPNVIKYYDYYEEEGNSYIVMEYCSGGELYDRIIEKKPTENEAANIVRCILRAVNHCHSNNILHRDIKPENIMYSATDTSSQLKIIDFGLSKKCCGIPYDNRVVGTPYYMSPESVDGVYCKASDVWSIGVILYLLLTGYLPFGGENKDETLEKIHKFKGLTYKNTIWASISDSAKDLLSKLMEPNWELRITAYEALQHPFLTIQQSTVPLSIDSSIVDALKQYKQLSIARRKLLNAISLHVSKNEIDKLIKQFEVLDVEKTGLISTKCLKSVFKGKIDEQILKSTQIDQLFNYTDFISAIISFNSLLSEDSLRTMFSEMASSSNKGTICKNDLKAISPLRKRFNSDDANEILGQYDKNGDGQLDYEEFKTIFDNNMIRMHNICVIDPQGL